MSSIIQHPAPSMEDWAREQRTLAALENLREQGCEVPPSPTIPVPDTGSEAEVTGYTAHHDKEIPWRYSTEWGWWFPQWDDEGWESVMLDLIAAMDATCWFEPPKGRVHTLTVKWKTPSGFSTRATTFTGPRHTIVTKAFLAVYRNKYGEPL